MTSGFNGKGFVPQNKRWIIERTFALLDRYRRLARGYEDTSSSAEQMTIIAGLMIVLHHIPHWNN
ncbi:MAG: transposase [Bacteroidales bacterium]|nr:transposase [Bacteroidales bacterium]